LKIEEIIHNPGLNKYMTTFQAGQTVFLEGDHSEDLYILVSGALDVLKGKKKISDISGVGSFFGEMSLLLGAKRTATVKAKDDVRAILIPKEEITAFLREFPDVGMEITRALARRLDETSQMFYGFKEFCDQLPDAVVFTDKDGKIFSWNAAAEALYGRDWQQMSNQSMEAIYEDPEAYKALLAEVQKGAPVKEKVLAIKDPDGGSRFISTSTTMLYDGHHNFQGVLSLSRDVTAVQSLERRYRRARYWLLPSLAMVVLLAVVALFGYPYVSKGYRTVSVKEQELKDQMAKDYLLIKSLLADSFMAGDRSKTSRLLQEVLKLEHSTTIPYTGIVLLDQDKKVFDAYSVKMGSEAMKIVGTTYAGIPFQGSDHSFHRVLTLYRTDQDHPMGTRGVEIAFEMRKDDQFLGWLVFQMDVDLLKKVYGVDEEGLKKLRFESP
jgi:PAS domain S-box-containing protein